MNIPNLCIVFGTLTSNRCSFVLKSIPLAQVLIRKSSSMNSFSFNSPPGSPILKRISSIASKAISFNGTNSSLLLPPTVGQQLQVTPIHSPCASPPPTMPPSGYLEEVKSSLLRAVSKRFTKTSSLSIDEDMKDMCNYFKHLGTEEKDCFLIYLATEHSVDHSAVDNMINNKPPADQLASVIKWEDKLRCSLQPPHAWVISQISRLTGGVKFLVDLRHHLLVCISNQSDEETLIALKYLDATLKEMLSLWFTVGLLQLTRITWESSCLILQKISDYEAVHPIRNWTDLKRRVGQYRRCFIFTHSCMPNEPLVVLHTFLTNEISKSMTKIVQNPRFTSEDDEKVTPLSDDAEDSSTITTAIFYSINSTQKGLQGIELGNYLIKKVVKELQAELPHLSQFSSLSPIPSFTKWLQSALAKAIRGEMNLFKPSELETLSLLLLSSSGEAPLKEEQRVGTSADEENQDTDDSDSVMVYKRLRQLLSNNSWNDDESVRAVLEAPLMRLCAYYLYVEKRRLYALDSVANFHLKNGAVMWRINWAADPSVRGLSNSCGMMVNYRYFLSESERFSREYQEQQFVNADQSVVELAREAEAVIANGEKKMNNLTPASA